MAWELLDNQLDARTACKEYVALLKVAAEHEEALISGYIEQLIEQNILPKASEIESLLSIDKPSSDVKIRVKHGDLKSYNQFLTGENQ